MKIINCEDGVYKLGESARENWSLLEESCDDHYFFHLASFSSGYVILEPKVEVTISLLQKASLLCKQNTKYRNINNIKVDYCMCKNVEKGNNMGEAIYKSNRKVMQIKIIK
jgi:predicted ribosome quality control (RQC) complex YloA/Tae2 family protein